MGRRTARAAALAGSLSPALRDDGAGDERDHDEERPKGGNLGEVAQGMSSNGVHLGLLIVVSSLYVLLMFLSSWLRRIFAEEKRPFCQEKIAPLQDAAGGALPETPRPAPARQDFRRLSLVGPWSSSG